MKVQPKPNHNDINGWFVIGMIPSELERSWGGGVVKRSEAGRETEVRRF